METKTKSNTETHQKTNANTKTHPKNILCHFWLRVPVDPCRILWRRKCLRGIASISGFGAAKVQKSHISGQSDEIYGGEVITVPMLRLWDLVGSSVSPGSRGMTGQRTGASPPPCSLLHLLLVHLCTHYRLNNVASHVDQWGVVTSKTRTCSAVDNSGNQSTDQACGAWRGCSRTRTMDL